MLKIFKVFKKKLVMSVVSALVASGGLMVVPNQNVYADAKVKSAAQLGDVIEKANEGVKSFLNNIRDDEKLQAELLDFSAKSAKMSRNMVNVNIPLGDPLGENVKMKERLELFGKGSDLKQQVRNLGEDIELLKQGESEEEKKQALNEAKSRIKTVNKIVDVLKSDIEKTGLGSDVVVPEHLEELLKDDITVSDEISAKLKEDAKSVEQFADGFMQEIKRFDYDELRDCFRRMMGLFSEYQFVGENSELGVSKIDLPDSDQSMVCIGYAAKKGDKFIGDLDGKGRLGLEIVDLRTDKIVFSNDILMINANSGLFKQFMDLGNSFLKNNPEMVKGLEDKKYDRIVFTGDVVDRVDLNGEYKLNLVDKDNNNVVLRSVNFNFNLKPISEQKKNELSNAFIDSLKCQFDLVEGILVDGIFNKVLQGGVSYSVQ